MLELNCSAHRCVHNKDEKCEASAIQVRGGMTRSSSDTFCNTFTDNTGEYIMTAVEHMMSNTPSAEGMDKGIIGDGLFTSRFADTEIAGELYDGSHPSVTCTASKCKYNRNYICAAENLTILGPEHTDKGRTVCRTFKLV